MPPNAAPTTTPQAKIAEEAAEFVSSLPAPVQERVVALRGLQKTHNELVDEYRQEREALEAKYRVKYGE